jgi:hypothetical protein
MIAYPISLLAAAMLVFSVLPAGAQDIRRKNQCTIKDLVYYLEARLPLVGSHRMVYALSLAEADRLGEVFATGKALGAGKRRMLAIGTLQTFCRLPFLVCFWG